METTGEIDNDYPFVKQMCDETKHLQKEIGAELNNFLKNEVKENTYYKKVEEQIDKLEKDNEAYRASMRTFQLGYEKVPIQIQQDSRLPPEILNEVKTMCEILISTQEQLLKICNDQLVIQKDGDQLSGIYKSASEEVEIVIREMNRLTHDYETIYTAEKQANKALLKQLQRYDQMYFEIKQNSQNITQEMQSKFKTFEMKNKETESKHVQLQAVIASLRSEMQKKDEEIIKMKEYGNSILQKNIEMEKRIQYAEKVLQKFNEAMTPQT